MKRFLSTLVLLSIIYLLSGCCPLFSPAAPPSYGVYLKNGSKLVSMPMFKNWPSSLSSISGIPIASSNRPVIVLNIQNVDVNLVSIANESFDKADFEAAPNRDGTINLTLLSVLAPGYYYVHLGNYMLPERSIPKYVFQVK